MKKLNVRRTIGILLITLSGLAGVYVIGVNVTSNVKLGNLLQITPSQEETATDIMSYQMLDDDQVVLDITEGVSSLEIPDLDIKTPVLDGVDSNTLAYAAGRFQTSAKIGEVGNLAICGHSSSIYTCIFNNLANIRVGQAMYFTDTQGNTFTYYCTGKRVIEPTDWSVVDEADETGVKECTIITCTENGTKRLVVKGKVMSKDEYEKYMAELNSAMYVELYQALADMSTMQYDYAFIENETTEETTERVQTSQQVELVTEEVTTETTEEKAEEGVTEDAVEQE